MRGRTVNSYSAKKKKRARKEVKQEGKRSRILKKGNRNRESKFSRFLSSLLLGGQRPGWGTREDMGHVVAAKNVPIREQTAASCSARHPV